MTFEDDDSIPLSAHRRRKELQRTSRRPLLALIMVLMMGLFGGVISIVLTFVASQAVFAVLSGALAVTLVVLAVGIFEVLTRSLARDVDVALLGLPAAGKTSFAVALHHELMQPTGPTNLIYSPDTATAIRVTEAFGAFYHGQYPGATAPGKLTRLAGRARLRLPSILGSRYANIDIQVFDSAGEHFDELSPAAALPRTSYFKTIVESDALIVLFPADVLTLADAALVHRYVDDLIASLQVIIDVAGGRRDLRLTRPVTLVISKADIVFHDSIEVPRLGFEIEKWVSSTPPRSGRGQRRTRDLAHEERPLEGPGREALLRLIRFMQHRCADLEVSFVSAVGFDFPGTVAPHNVVESFARLLRRTVRSSRE